MPMPPEHIEPTELWTQLTTTPRPHRLVDFPREYPEGHPRAGEPVGNLAMWVLTQEEQMAANAEAEKFARRLLKDGKRGDIGYEALFDNEGAVQVLFRSCRDAKDLKRPAFPSPELMRSKLSADEIGRLFEHYLTISLELGPIVVYMGDGEREAWIRRIAEGGSAFPLDLLSSELRKTLFLSMACQLVSYWTDTSSAGSPPESDSSSTPSLDSEPESEW